MRNFHTHTKLCNHGEGMPDDYCRAALEKGVTHLGFSDHSALPGNYGDRVRMSIDQLPLYIDSVRQAQKDFPELKIYLGMECDYAPEHESFYREVLMHEQHFDYLIGSIHYYEYNGFMRWMAGPPFAEDEYDIYAEKYVCAMRSGLFLFMAHPDLFAGVVPEWNKNAERAAERICRASRECGVPLEFNSSGFRRTMAQRGSGDKSLAMELFFGKDDGGTPMLTPRLEFWRVAAAYDVPVVVNSDAHYPELLDAYLDAAYGIVEKLGLRNVTNELPMK